MRLEAGRKIGYAIKAPHVKALEIFKTKDGNRDHTSENAGAALSIERSVLQKSSRYSHLWDGRKSESSEQISAVNFEDGSEYVTQDEPV